MKKELICRCGRDEKQKGGLEIQLCEILYSARVWREGKGREVICMLGFWEVRSDVSLDLLLGEEVGRCQL